MIDLVITDDFIVNLGCWELVPNSSCEGSPSIVFSNLYVSYMRLFSPILSSKTIPEILLLALSEVCMNGLRVGLFGL